jgi:hypothetical protein
LKKQRNISLLLNRGSPVKTEAEAVEEEEDEA